MKPIILWIIALGLCTLPLFAHAYDTWRIAERNTTNNDYIYVDDYPQFFTDYFKETPHYSQSYPDVMDSIVVLKKHQQGSTPGTWQHYSVVHMNPIVLYSNDYRIIKYRISNSGLSYNHRTEVYDTNNRLYQLTKANFDPDYGNWYGQRTTYFYTQDNSLESYVTYYANPPAYYEKSVPTFDNEGKKAFEIIYTSADSSIWTPIKKHIFSYTGETYPPGFCFKPHHPMEDFSMINYWGTYARYYYPGLITPFVVDSVIVQDYENGDWVDEIYQKYSFNTESNNTIGINIEFVELAMIPYPPDYFPPFLSFGYNSNGLYSGHSFSGDDGLSPPWFQSLSYVWQEISALDEQTNTMPNIFISSYPNPFNNNVLIKLNSPKSAPSDISIYNIKGQLVRSWKDVKSGELSWDGKDNSNHTVKSGVYLIKANQGSAQHTHKVIKY